MEKKLRVKTKQDFQKVISSNKKINSETFVVYYLKNEDYNYPRFGIAVSKKMGGAVQRVKIRRQIRMMIREIIKEINVISMDYIIIVRKKYEQNDYSTNKQKLKKLFLKFGGKTSE